jgi:hypothetical protein
VKASVASLLSLSAAKRTLSRFICSRGISAEPSGARGYLSISKGSSSYLARFFAKEGTLGRQRRASVEQQRLARGDPVLGRPVVPLSYARRRRRRQDAIDSDALIGARRKLAAKPDQMLSMQFVAETRGIGDQSVNFGRQDRRHASFNLALRPALGIEGELKRSGATRQHLPGNFQFSGSVVESEARLAGWWRLLNDATALDGLA